MKEIKAYVHRSRVGDVIAALEESVGWGGHRGNRRHNLAIYIVKGSLMPLGAQEQRYSVELSEEVIDEYKLELLCDDDEVQAIVAALLSAGRTGQPVAGWITVADVLQVVPIH